MTLRPLEDDVRERRSTPERERPSAQLDRVGDRSRSRLLDESLELERGRASLRLDASACTRAPGSRRRRRRAASAARTRTPGRASRPSPEVALPRARRRGGPSTRSRSRAGAGRRAAPAAWRRRAGPSAPRYAPRVARGPGTPCHRLRRRRSDRTTRLDRFSSRAQARLHGAAEPSSRNRMERSEEMTLYGRSSRWAAALALGLAGLIGVRCGDGARRPRPHRGDRIRAHLRRNVGVEHADYLAPSRRDGDVQVPSALLRHGNVRRRPVRGRRKDVAVHVRRWHRRPDGSRSRMRPVYLGSWQILGGSGSYAGLRGDVSVRVGERYSAARATPWGRS